MEMLQDRAGKGLNVKSSFLAAKAVIKRDLSFFMNVK